jgi:hypothetical protein
MDLTCSRHDVAEKLLAGIKQPLTHSLNLLWKESWISVGHKFHQYQQNGNIE